MPTRAIDLVYPLAGLHRGAALQRQPPYTTPDAQNMRPRDVFDQRERGGSRPGVTREFGTQFIRHSTLIANHHDTRTINVEDPIFADYMVGDSITIGSTPTTIEYVNSAVRCTVTDTVVEDADAAVTLTASTIQCITSLPYVVADGVAVLEDDFQHGLSGRWEAPTNVGTTLPTVTDGMATCPYGATVTAVHQALDITKGATPWASWPGLMAEMLIVPDNGKYSGKYRLYLYLEDNDPDKDSASFELEIVANGSDGVVNGTFKKFSGGVQVGATITFAQKTFSHVDAGWLSLNHKMRNGYLKVMFRGETLYVGTTVVTSPSETPIRRFGFQIENNEIGTTGKVKLFRLVYHRTTEERTWREAALVVAQGAVWYERSDHLAVGVHNAPGVGRATLLGRNDFLQAIPFYKKTYILDQGGPVKAEEETPGNVDVYWKYLGLDGLGYLKWRSDGINFFDWNSLFLTQVSIKDYRNCALLIYAADYPGTYRIYDIGYGSDTEGLLFRHPTGFTENTEPQDAKFYLNRTPKQITYSDEDGVYMEPSWTTDPSGVGDIPRYFPLGCRVGAKFGERIFLAGDPRTPFGYYLCRHGDPDDWDYGQTDSGAAIAGSLLGLYGREITSAAPFSDDYLVVGTLGALWIMRGDPGLGGTMDNLSQNVGIVGPHAWCWLPEGDLIFLAADGLYRLPPGANVYPIPLSRDRIPKELLQLDWHEQRICLAYEPTERGVLINFTPKQHGGTTAKSYWFDPKAGSFWPDSSPFANDRVVMYSHSGLLPGTSRAGLLIGGRGGYVYKTGMLYRTDDDVGIDAYVKYGPFRLASNNLLAGLITELVATLGDESNDVTWELFTGDSGEAALASTTVVETGTLSAGANYVQLTRRRAHSAVLKFSSSGNSRWALEAISAVLRDAGRHRLV